MQCDFMGFFSFLMILFSFRYVKWNFEKFQREYPECTRDFEGVKMEHIPMIEQCFNKRIEIFTKRTVNGTGK